MALCNTLSYDILYLILAKFSRIINEYHAIRDHCAVCKGPGLPFMKPDKVYRAPFTALSSVPFTVTSWRSEQKGVCGCLALWQEPGFDWKVSVVSVVSIYSEMGGGCNINPQPPLAPVAPTRRDQDTPHPGSGSSHIPNSDIASAITTAVPTSALLLSYEFFNHIKLYDEPLPQRLQTCQLEVMVHLLDVY